jgi:hypothetical protein
MVNNTDDDLDFLMTSDYNEDYSPDEFKKMLIRWRYFYRLLYGRNSINIKEYESLKERKEKEITEKDFLIRALNKELKRKESLISYLSNKKLTFKERLFGKIINNI